MADERYLLTPALQLDPPRLMGSYDPVADQTYFPPRMLSVDGQLRQLELVELPVEGVLYSFTRMGKTIYGQVDLANKVRILATLAAGEYEIGTPCKLEILQPESEGAETTWRFARA